MNKIDEMVKNYGDTLSPDYEIEEKVWNVVNSKLYPKRSSSLLSNFFRLLTMKKSIKLMMSVLIVCFIASVPIYIGVAGQRGSTAETVNSLISDKDREDPEQYYVKEKATTGSLNTDNSTKESERAKNVNGNFVYTVSDIWQSTEKVNQFITDFGAYTSSVSVSTTGAYYVIKVPVGKFNEMHDKLRSLAVNVVEEKIETTDKQNEVATQESNIKKYEDQIVALKEQLKKAKTESEKNTINGQIATATTARDLAKAGLDQFMKTVDFATVSLSLKKEGSSLGLNLEQTLRETLYKVQDVLIVWVNVVLFVVVAVVATCPVWIPIVVLAKRSRKSKKEAKV